MRETLVGIALLLCAGCTQIPQWNTAEQKVAEAELGNATTQLEMNSAMGAIATLAEKRMLVALDDKLSRLPQTERLALLRNQQEWQRWAERRNQESMGDGSIAPMLRHGREESRLKNRFIELTVSEDTRQAFIAMQNAPIRFHDKLISLWHGEMDIKIPMDKWHEGMPKTETIGQLQIPFCRVIHDGKDTFEIGVLEATNYGVMSSFGEGTESNLCVWKNGKNFANFLIGKKITIQNISTSDNMIKVSFLDEEEKLQQKEFNYRLTNENSVQINHWTTERID